MLAVAKSKKMQILFACLIGLVILLLPRPEGTRFKISGDNTRLFYETIKERFSLIEAAQKAVNGYVVEARQTDATPAPDSFLLEKAKAFKESNIKIDYLNGLSKKAMRFLAVLGVLIFLFLIEPIPLEITAVLIGASLVLMGIVDVKTAWAPYMHPVVVFIMCCLIYAISLDKAGLTKRLGHFIVQKAGTNVVRFTFIISIGLGLASMFMHDAAAVSIGIVTMLPLMRAADIKPHSGTAKFMLISLAFACNFTISMFGV